VPHRLAGTKVWVRATAEEVVIMAGEGSPGEVVATASSVPTGPASVDDAHYPPRRRDPLQREPRPTKAGEAAFLALGEGAALYLIEAAAAGVRRIEARMAEAVALAALDGHDASTMPLARRRWPAASPMATWSRS
jgi:hypothetical protein